MSLKISGLQTIKMIPIYWINLEESTDRKIIMMNTFLSQNMPNRRVSAIRHQNGVTGCALSHIKAIHTAWMEGNDMVIISEDDADYSCGKRIMDIVKIMLDTLPNEIKNDWDILQIQYTEPHFSKGVNNYLNEYIRYDGDINTLKNRLLKGYLYGSVSYLINRKGMTKFLNLMTKIDPEDISKYTITCTLDHPRAGPEELIYRYLNTYMTTYPIVNYLFNESTINTKEYYTTANEINRVISNKNIELLSIDNYKIIENKKIYVLEYDLHWFNGGKEEVEGVINDIFNNH